MALFLDVETTGLPDNKGLPYGKYPLCNLLDKYENARIVQICVMLCNEKFEEIVTKDYIIKADFDIPNSAFHNITNEISQTKGISFPIVMKEITELLKQASHIFAHNSDFDINVLKSELHRAGLDDIIRKIDNRRVICTMNHTRNIVKIMNYYGIKDPKLSELYKFATNKELSNAHNAKYDVIHLHEAIKKLYDDNKLIFPLELTKGETSNKRIKL
jgi:DNA polymerase III epsilon subunit-like protein